MYGKFFGFVCNGWIVYYFWVSYDGLICLSWWDWGFMWWVWVVDVWVGCMCGWLM